jgi:hypothetical protein
MPIFVMSMPDFIFLATKKEKNLNFVFFKIPGEGTGPRIQSKTLK